MNFIKKWIYKILFRKRLKDLARKIDSEVLDFFIETILRLMKLIFIISDDYRKNIEGFGGKYSFVSRDGEIAASITFKNGKVKVFNEEIQNPDIKVIFKDNKAIKNFLFSENPDIIAFILDNEISYNGNLNYLFKFAYMAKHLQLMFVGH